jgi:hypothetical protein
VSKIPESYVLNKFYSHAIDPTFRKHDGTYNAACPVCKEGRSLGKKKRLFFYPKTNTFHCFNCSKTWSAYSWIINVCNITKDELDQEINSKQYSTDVSNKSNLEYTRYKELPDLPHDSINLFDEVQQKFYSKDGSFYKSLEYVKQRRLHTAINKSPNLFISLTDYTHKNRLCIPFYDRNKKIVFYQTRAMDHSEPRYLGKLGCDKTVFGIDRITNDIPYIFMFEGPIDSMFVRNGVSLAGLSISEKQAMQLAEFPFHRKIWVLDNPKFDETANKKTRELVSQGEQIFLWDSTMPYKDFNDMCVDKKIDEIDYKLITNNFV